VKKCVVACLITLLTFVIASCGGGGSQPSIVPQPPPPTPCAYTLSIDKTSIAAAGDSGQATLTVLPGASACNWSASADNSWVTLSKTSGSGPDSLTYTVASNAGDSSRDAKISVNWSGGSDNKSITQAGKSSSCGYTLELSKSSIGAGGDSGVATVRPSPATSSCRWDATTDSPGFVTLSGSNGSGSGTFGYSVNANTTNNSRSASLTITWSGGSTRQSLTQAAGAGAAALTASFKFTATSPAPPKGADCGVSSGFKVNCTFDATASTPASSITKYDFLLVETNERLGSGASAILTNPTLASCNVFNKSTNGLITATIRLTVTASDGRTQPKELPVVLGKNGVC